MKKKGLIFSLFGQAVKDKSPEEIEQLAMDAAAVLDEETAPAKEGSSKEEPPKEGTADGADGGAVQQIDDAALDALAEKLMARMAAKKAAEEDKDPLDAAIEALASGGAGEGEGGAARVVPAAEMDKGCGMDKALAAGILKAMRPSVAAIQDGAQRKAVSDALIGLVTARDGRDDTAAILKASQANAEHMADREPTAMDADAIQALYDGMNPHKRKESER